MAWGLVLGWIATLVISYAMRPKPPAGPPAATLDSFKPGSVTEGMPVGVIFGQVWINTYSEGWRGDFRAKAIREKEGGLF